MNAHHIIKKPLITEKSTNDSEDNRYAFQVARTADKDQIKAAIKELYDVRVTGINTCITKGGTRRTRYGIVESPKVKKAIVRVHPEDRIELF